MVTLATLMYEILLTRIFSVTMWYHFAFMAISVTLFGMTVGAVLVYLFPNFFTREKAKYHMALSALLFSIAIVFSFLTQVIIPFAFHKSIGGLYSLAFIYVIVAVPFVLSGVCVCLALTRFPAQVSKLYAVDLLGAALGCILLIYALKFSDGPTAVVAVAFFAALGAWLFALDAGDRKLRRNALIWAAVFALFTLGHSVLVSKNFALLRLMWVKGKLENRALYEKWNSFSRVRIDGDPDELLEPFGWGFSPGYPREKTVRRLSLRIDAWAGTPVTHFDGDTDKLEYLKYDVVNLAHYLRQDADVLVIGTGGGRDILSALAFEQKSVRGVEMNRVIIDALNKQFGDFSGHLDRYPNVTFVNDEARSYISRLEEKFDIIQSSLIDTYAATAAGAFALTENSLYTVEAWEIFMQHLKDDGILTFSRWWFPDRPDEMYRSASLAAAALQEMGIENPRAHIVIANNLMEEEFKHRPQSAGTILVSKQPFTEQELDKLERVAGVMEFNIALSPRTCSDPVFEKIASGEDVEEFIREFPINIAAPTDNSPFFFNMLRFKDFLKPQFRKLDIVTLNLQPVVVLGALLLIVIVLTFLCIIVPLLLTTKKAALKGSLPLFLFFAGIGLGFMLVEISQVQRLAIFLGHPTYSLSVVLFSLLVASGLGSFTTQGINLPKMKGSAILRLVLLIGVLLIFGMLTPYAISLFQGSTTTTRILIATVILFPIGLFMGMAFPLGLKIASSRSDILTPWLWGINGATSVCASVLAVVIALNYGISTSFWIGFGFYILALMAFVWAGRGAAEAK